MIVPVTPGANDRIPSRILVGDAERPERAEAEVVLVR